MKFRKGKKSDLKKIIEMVNQAKEYFKLNNINQWQNGYPCFETILNDIENGCNYVLEKEGIIVASTAVMFGREETYDKIYEGKWLTNEDYTVIHRIVVDNKFKGLGLASKILDEVEVISKKKNIYSIKIDTHKDNLSMQNFIYKNNFKYCGRIILKDGQERVAFEKNFY